MSEFYCPSAQEWHQSISTTLQTPPSDGPKTINQEGGMDVFELTALNLYYDFLSRTTKTDYSKTPNINPETFKRGSINSGYLAVGRLVGLSVPAYRNYCAESETTPTSDDITNILRHRMSFVRTPFFLANMPISVNRVYEQFVGITGNTYTRPGDRRYRSDYTTLKISNAYNDRFLEINPEVLEDAKKEVALFGVSGNSKLTARCAAIQRPLKIIWGQMIGSCVQNGVFDEALKENL